VRAIIHMDEQTGEGIAERLGLRGSGTSGVGKRTALSMRVSAKPWCFDWINLNPDKACNFSCVYCR